MKPTFDFGKKPVFFDGAMGTMLQQAGMRPGMSPERFMLESPDRVTGVHRRYIDAGVDVLTTNTFGANRIKLGEYRLDHEIDRINRLAVQCARDAAGDTTWIAGSIGPSGLLLRPMGSTTMDELQSVFSEQARILRDAGVDFAIIETMGDLGELLAAIRACLDTGLPFIPSMSFDPHLRSLSGSTPESYAVTAEPYEPLAIGVNCGLGPDIMVEVVRRMAAETALPLLAQPNAGLPQLIDGVTRFSLQPVDFASQMLRMIDAGAAALGGCCGTTPDHIAAVTHSCRNAIIQRQVPESAVRFASRAGIVRTGAAMPFTVIGERINPTGRKKLSTQLAEGDLSMVRADARKQIEAGAMILDVNMGVPGQPEDLLMTRAVDELQAIAPATPLSIDSMSVEAIEAGLKTVIGRPLLNSINGEDERIEALLPLVKRYGANFIALAMDSTGIPEDADARIRIAEKIVRKAEAIGIDRSRILIDCLVFTVGSQPHQPNETLKAVERVRNDLGCATILGVSNVSFGLPNRDAISSTYLAMALRAGLNAGIINPLSISMMQGLRAGELLLNRDPGARRYVSFQEYASAATPTPQPAKSMAPAAAPDRSVPVFSPSAQAVVDGDKDRVCRLIDEELTAGIEPARLLEESLIPAIAAVGAQYGAGIVFLPQLILAGETMKAAVGHLRPRLKESGSQLLHGTKIVLGTVAGDIHDIGKNIVSVVLENHGFDVIDLGKDVSADRFAECVEDSRARLVGLSALMTTTMPAMRETVRMLKERFSSIRILVGGAVVTRRFADEIGADGYAADAVGAGDIARTMAGLQGNLKK